MKKEIGFLLFLLTGLTHSSFAGTGNAADGMYFVFIVAGILLLVSGLFAGKDFLKKNGKKLLANANTSIKLAIARLKNLLRKIKHGKLDLSYF